MRVKIFFILLLLPCLAASFGVWAQQHAVNDTVMKGTTIEVVQSYKPRVKKAPKPEWVPQLPVADTTHPSFNYDVPQQTLYYSYSSLPLRPLALGRDTTTLPFQNYVKAGAGNLSTLYLDAGIGSIKGDNYETAIHLHHISQKGAIQYQQSALSGIEADGVLHSDNADWHFGVVGERNQYFNYGYPDGAPKDSLKNTYTTIRINADMQNKMDKDDKWSYHPAINASYYNGRSKASETNIGFNIPVSYDFDEMFYAQAALVGSIANYNVNSVTIGNSYAELLPGVGIHANQFTGHALLGLAVGKQGDYVLPDLLAAYSTADSKFMISGGWQASLRQNTYEQLSTENPYMLNTYAVQQTRKDEIFLQVQGGAGSHLTYSGRVSLWSYDHLPTFINYNIPKEFFVLYDDNLKATSFRAGVRYQVANIWSAGITGDFYKFYNGSQQYVWGEPTVKIKGDFTVTPLPKLTVTAYLALLDGIHAVDEPSLKIVKLAPARDLGANAEYQFISRLSAFVQVSNLLNDKYQRWLGYQAYGINIYGGLRLKF